MIHNATEKRLNTLSDKEKESGKTALPWKIMITTRCFFVEFNYSLLLFFLSFSILYYLPSLQFTINQSKLHRWLSKKTLKCQIHSPKFQIHRVNKMFRYKL